MPTIRPTTNQRFINATRVAQLQEIHRLHELERQRYNTTLNNSVKKKLPLNETLKSKALYDAYQDINEKPVNAKINVKVTKPKSNNGYVNELECPKEVLTQITFDLYRRYINYYRDTFKIIDQTESLWWGVFCDQDTGQIVRMDFPGFIECTDISPMHNMTHFLRRSQQSRYGMNVAGHTYYLIVNHDFFEEPKDINFDA